MHLQSTAVAKNHELFEFIVSYLDLIIVSLQKNSAGRIMMKLVQLKLGAIEWSMRNPKFLIYI